MRHHTPTSTTTPRRWTTHAAPWLLCLAMAMASCSSNADAPYPSLITDFVMAVANVQGQLATLITDNGNLLTVDNSVTGLPAGARVRAMCSYEPLAENHVQVYTIQQVPVLRQLPGDMSVRRHPIGVAGVWHSGGFINMHLTPKTHGGVQSWAFTADSAVANAAGGITHCIALYHDQAADTEAYTGHLYASISPDSIATSFNDADSIRLSIATYSGTQTWQFTAR